jgi:hypothetical protein
MHRLATAALVSAIGALAHATPQPLPTEIVDVRWIVGSTVFGDFTCRGLRDMARFGTSKRSGFVVMVQPSHKKAKPSYLVFATRGRKPQNIRLAVESLDFNDDAAFKQEVAESAPGLRPSTTCQGLSLGDGETDAHHIYWNTGKKAFESWSL